MLESRKSRTVMITIMIIALLFLFVWHGSLSPAPERGRYPGADELVDDYEDHIGEKVEVGGEVLEIDPVRIEVESAGDTMILEIVDLKEQPGIGDRLTVFGTAGENKTIYAQNAMTRPLWRYVYMYGISVVGATWVGFRVLGQWRFDREKFALEPRDKPLTIREIIYRSKGGDEDS